jgi:hypothetical protein
MREFPGLKYYVHLGEFQDEVPQSFANAIILASEHAMITETGNGSITVFHTESVGTYMEALQLMDFLANEGIQNTKIVAVFQGTEVSLADASRIRNGEHVELKLALIPQDDQPLQKLSLNTHELTDEELDAVLKRGGR